MKIIYQSDYDFSIKVLTCESVRLWTIVSFPTLILRVDKASFSSPMSHPINLATVIKPEHEKKETNSNELRKNSSSNQTTMKPVMNGTVK